MILGSFSNGRMSEPISAAGSIVEPIPMCKVKEEVSQLGEVLKITTTKILWPVFYFEQ